MFATPYEIRTRSGHRYFFRRARDTWPLINTEITYHQTVTVLINDCEINLKELTILSNREHPHSATQDNGK